MPPPPVQATTLRRAKAQYRKSGPQIAPAEQRRLARQVELDRRAQAARDKDARRKKAEKARADKEEKEREKRKQLGVGLATQLAGYSVTQKQMKGGMEDWLGVGGAVGKKRKRDEDAVEEKENRGYEEAEACGSGPKKADDSFGSHMSLDEALLEQLDDKSQGSNTTTTCETGQNETTLPPANDEDTSAFTTVSPAQDDDDRQHEQTSRKSENKITPPTKRAKTLSSPEDGWAHFLDSNTQILQDLSQSPPQISKRADSISPPQFSTQDLEITSDDWFETGLPKTGNPQLCPKEGVIVRDFAYSDSNASGNFTAEVPGAPSLPRKSRTEKSMLRSFGKRHTIATASPKMTATCATFTVAQCSFTSNYQSYGLSTQLLQEALDDGDDDTEDEDEEVYSQALEASKIPDKVRMPPPPMRLSPKVFKPPTKNDLFTGKGGLQIFGLSTQLLNDAVDDDELTDEDEDDGLFNIPLNRPPIEETSVAAKHAPAQKGQHGFGDLGFPTQVLREAALDEIDFTDDEDTQGS